MKDGTLHLNLLKESLWYTKKIPFCDDKKGNWSRWDLNHVTPSDIFEVMASHLVNIQSILKTGDQEVVVGNILHPFSPMASFKNIPIQDFLVKILEKKTFSLTKTD